jgi:hypothetical protein
MANEINRILKLFADLQHGTAGSIIMNWYCMGLIQKSHGNHLG